MKIIPNESLSRVIIKTMHELAIDILTGHMSGIALKRRQIDELSRAAVSEPERIALLEQQCRELSESVAVLQEDAHEMT